MRPQKKRQKNEAAKKMRRQTKWEGKKIRWQKKETAKKWDGKKNRKAKNPNTSPPENSVSIWSGSSI